MLYVMRTTYQKAKANQSFMVDSAFDPSEINNCLPLCSNLKILNFKTFYGQRNKLCHIMFFKKCGCKT